MGSMNVAAYSWNQQREVFVFWSMESKLRLQFPVTTSAGRIATSRICIAGRRIRAGLTKNTKFADLIAGRSFTFQSVSRALSIRGGGPLGARESSLAVQAGLESSGRSRAFGQVTASEKDAAAAKTARGVLQSQQGERSDLLQGQFCRGPVKLQVHALDWEFKPVGDQHSLDQGFFEMLVHNCHQAVTNLTLSGVFKPS